MKNKERVMSQKNRIVPWIRNLFYLLFFIKKKCQLMINDKSVNLIHFQQLIEGINLYIHIYIYFTFPSICYIHLQYRWCFDHFIDDILLLKIAYNIRRVFSCLFFCISVCVIWLAYVIFFSLLDNCIFCNKIWSSILNERTTSSNGSL